MAKSTDPRLTYPHLAHLFSMDGALIEVTVGQAPWEAIVKIDGHAVCCTDIRFRIDPQNGQQRLELSLMRDDSTAIDTITFSSPDDWVPFTIAGRLYVLDVHTAQSWRR